MSKSGLSPKQLAVITELIKGKSITQVAQEIKVNEKTIDRWFKYDEEFSETYEDRKVDLLEHGFLMALNSFDEIHQCLMGIIRDPDSANRDKIAASKAITSEIDRFERIHTARKIQSLDLNQSLIDDLIARGVLSEPQG